MARAFSRDADRDKGSLSHHTTLPRLVTPVPEQAPIDAMPPRNLRNFCPRPKALRQDPGLLLRRPEPSLRLPRDQLNAPIRASLMTVLMTVFKPRIGHCDISAHARIAKSFNLPLASS
jgi:hypothetical protein